ncbi:S46 family peptidase [Novosphingobium mangrovi (ex Huang et al. 2023)]|uniref:Dipeptidyl-peptidase n=1 Tax=Novosphingobium mangrovi (ex Huang et al. 2023) TaxID=2976432 RepID=A0ABT2I2T5_9SPHN|nr:S46 family peptidase [Novosphingobium mangrovi (ex Huang et al. 2023)]MCT2399108.1 S46 family peptidase [Novosphingobium mangrovi (ex Huang et al. 2023)]
MTTRSLSLLAGTAALLAFTSSSARADEGMWTFDGFPRAKMEADYGWAPDQAWLDKVRNAAVRLTGGCSASFVSGNGLILTNHHCVASCLFDNSTGEDDLLDHGFIAARLSDEKKCPGQQAEVVTKVIDVTGDVKKAIGSLAGEALTKARDARIAEIEAGNCTDRETTRCQVVTLFGGGQYKLYTYRKYSDVRLVWAPEDRAATFGGDPDNFNYPRYSLDGSFLRAYENGKPVRTPNHLKWNPRGPEEGEVTFVVGNPGSTSRLYTQSQLAFEREVRLPAIVTTYSELRGRLIRAMQESPEHEREGLDMLNGVENSLKVYIGRMNALNDPAFTGKLAAAEADLKARSAGKAGIGDPWSDMDKAVQAYRKLYFASRSIAPSGDLYHYARTLVMGAAERAKPNAERLPGYTDSALPLTEKRLLDAAPVYSWLDELRLGWSLSKAREYLGVDDPDTRLLLGKESPEGLAQRLVSGTKLADPAYRKQLWDGGEAAIAASDDPMIVYARKLEARQRELEKQVDEAYAGPATAAAAKLTDARFAAYGDTIYPDATFTLRISYGKVAGWSERGRPVPFQTVIGGTFDRATGAPPFDVAPAFAAKEKQIDKAVTYDFVSTNDIIGGNSGSPVIDKAGTVIGAAFDGNIHSLGGNYGYDPVLNRTVTVSAAALQEALETIYPSPRLVRELAGK